MITKASFAKLALTAALTLPAASFAAPANFLFDSANIASGSTSQFNTSVGAVVFNSDVAGIQVSVTGWSFTNGATNRLQQAAVTLSNRGLGVCNAEEATMLGCLNAGADNIAKDEFLLFSFRDSSGNPLTGNVDSVGLLSVLSPMLNQLFDSDVSYWAGNLTPASINNLTLTQFNSAFGSPITDNGNGLPRTVTVDDEGSAQYAGILFGAQSGEGNDEFRVRSMSANVPLPGTLALIGIAGLAGMAARKRKAA
jgi:hypothetical protein